MADTIQSTSTATERLSPIGPLQITVAAMIVIVSLLPMPLPLLILTPMVGLVFTPMAGWLSLAFLGAVAGLSGVLDYLPLAVGPINVYAFDLIAVLFAWTGIHATIHFNRMQSIPALEHRQERRLVAIWAVWSALGVYFLVYGLIGMEYPFDRAFGDFRRQVWYAAAFFVPLFFPYTKPQLAKLKYVITLAGLVVIAIGVYRVMTGNAARLDENWETGHLARRWMRIGECMTLSTLVAFLVLVVRSGKGALRKGASAAVCVAAVGLMLISGWRLAMVYAILAPALALLGFAWARREPIRNVVFAGTAAAVVALPALLLVPLLLPDVFARAMLDLRLRLVNDVVQGGFRSWAIAASMSEFESSPIVGKGFGFYLMVATRNQSGFFDYVEMSNAHNIFLTALYQTGLLGFIPFVTFHAYFVFYALRKLRRVSKDRLPVYVTMFVGYICYMGYASTQPFVSSQFIILYYMMGLMVCLSRNSGDPETNPGESRRATP